MTTDSRSVLRRVYLAQGVGSTIDGIGLSTAVLYFSGHVGLSAESIGAVLTFATTVALMLVIPIGVLADAIGLKRAAVGLGTLVAVAFVAYALAHSLWLYAVGRDAVHGHAGRARRRAPGDRGRQRRRRRPRPRARRHADADQRGHRPRHRRRRAGRAVGERRSVPGRVRRSRPRWRWLCTVILAGLPIRPRSAGAPRQRPGLIALRDRRFTAICALATIVLLTMPIIAVLLPLWITQRVHAPNWMAPVTLGLNALLVICTQTRWSSRISSDARAARSLAIGATALLAGCALIGAADVMPVAMLLAGTAVLTAGEIAAGAGMWQLAFSRIPTTAPGQYQAVYGMASSAARVLGPLAALPLILAAGTAGWLLLGLLIAAAATALSLMARAGVPVDPERDYAYAR